MSSGSLLGRWLLVSVAPNTLEFNGRDDCFGFVVRVGVFLCLPAPVAMLSALFYSSSI